MAAPIIAAALLAAAFGPVCAFAQEESLEAAAQPQAADGETGSGNGIAVDRERIALDLKGVDLIELFRILSQRMGLTIVPSRNVGGRVNVYLNNLSFSDALDVILISQGLAADRKGNIVYVMTGSEYETLYGEKYNGKRLYKQIRLRYAKPAGVFNALSQIKSSIGKVIADEATGTILLIDVPDNLALMEQAIEELDRPLQTEIFNLQYAKSDDIKAHISSAITTGPGELFVDSRSGKVVVSDLPEKMNKIKRMMTAFDKETQEVFIEAEILQISLRDEYQRGIDWERLLAAYKNLTFLGTFPVSASFTPSPDLTTASMKVTVGTVATDGYDATVQLLQTYGSTKILSRPRIAAVNNQEAKILVGSREAYVTSTLSQGDTTTVSSEAVEFIDVGIKLNVVPTINDDGFVTMKIKPEVSSVRETVTTSLGSRIPIVETAEAETVVKVKDGAMIMIAGLMKEDKRDTTTGTPGLMRLPFLQWIFGSRAAAVAKTEIVFFLTPRIITGETLVRWSEPERHVPPGMVPRDMQQRIIERKLNEELSSEKSAAPPATAVPAPQIAKDFSKNANEITQERVKGVKEF